MISDSILKQLENNPENIEGLLESFPNDHQEIIELAMIIRGLKADRIERKIEFFKNEEKIISEFGENFAKAAQFKKLQKTQHFFEEIEKNINTPNINSNKPRGKILKLSNTLRRLAAIFVLVICSIAIWWNIPIKDNTSSYYALGPTTQFRSNDSSSEILILSKDNDWKQVLDLSKNSVELTSIESFYAGIAHLYLQEYENAIPYFQKVANERLPGFENDARFNIVVCKWKTSSLTLEDLNSFLENKNNPHHKKALELSKTIR